MKKIIIALLVLSFMGWQMFAEHYTAYLTKANRGFFADTRNDFIHSVGNGNNVQVYQLSQLTASAPNQADKVLVALYDYEVNQYKSLLDSLKGKSNVLIWVVYEDRSSALDTSAVDCISSASQEQEGKRFFFNNVVAWFRK